MRENIMKFLLVATLFLFSLSLSAKAPVNDKILLTSVNTVVFRGEVTDNSALNIQLKLFRLALIRGAKDYPIYLVLDSPGGSIDAGLSFIEFAKVIRNLKTISIFAASMTSGIAEALPGERLVTQNGTMMFHRAAGSFRGYFETGEVESQLEYSKNIMRGMEKVNSDRLKLDISTYKELVRTELWIYAEDNVTRHAADRMVDLECSSTLTQSKESVSFDTVFGVVNVIFSGCPLMRSPTGGDTGKYLVMSIANYQLLKSLQLNK